MLCLFDEFTPECLAIKVARELNNMDVIEMLATPYLERRAPAHIGSGQGPELIAKAAHV